MLSVSKFLFRHISPRMKKPQLQRVDSKFYEDEAFFKDFSRLQISGRVSHNRKSLRDLPNEIRYMILSVFNWEGVLSRTQVDHILSLALSDSNLQSRVQLYEKLDLKVPNYDGCECKCCDSIDHYLGIFD